VSKQKNTNQNRNRIGMVVKDGYPICGRNTGYNSGVSGNTVRILALPQARALAKKVGGKAHEIVKIESVEDGSLQTVEDGSLQTYDSILGKDWGTK
jgi:hypothetical protein